MNDETKPVMPPHIASFASDLLSSLLLPLVVSYLSQSLVVLPYVKNIQAFNAAAPARGAGNPFHTDPKVELCESIVRIDDPPLPLLIYIRTFSESNG